MFGFVPYNKGLRRIDDRERGDALADFFGGGWLDRAFSLDTFRLDAEDKEKEYVVSADLPGVKKEEVSLNFDDGQLTISVKREENISEGEAAENDRKKAAKKDGKQQPKSYIYRERRFSSMQRSVYLEDAASEGADAKMENGVLTVTIPKVEKKENTYRIEIK